MAGAVGPNMAGNGGNGISPGYLFLPSDQLLLDFYLRKKVDGQEADDQVLGAIPTVDLFGRDAPPPWLLHPAAVAPSSSRKSSKVSWRSSGIVPRKVTDWFYCFARTSRRGPGSCRTTSCGTWLTSGGDKRVTAESDDDDDEEGGEEGVVTTLGYKSSLAFKIPAAGGGCAGGSKWIPTCWVMNEFKLIHRGGHPDVIGRMEEAAATCKKIYYKNNGSGRVFVQEEAAADQLVLCRIRCTKVLRERPGAALKSGLGSRVGEEPPEKRQRSEGELGGQASLAVAAPAAALDHMDPIEGEEGRSQKNPLDLRSQLKDLIPEQQQQVVTSGAGDLGVELMVVMTEGEGYNQNVPLVQQQQQQQVAAPAAALDHMVDPIEGEEGRSQKNPPQQQLVAVTPGAGDLDVQELIVRSTEGSEGCSSHNVPDPQQVPVTPGAGRDSTDEEYCWMSNAAPDDEMWGMLISSLNE